MEDTKACLTSYILTGDGHAQTVDLATVTPEDNRLIWIHLNGRHPDAKKFLKEQLFLDSMIIRALLAEETRPRIEEIGDNAMIILRGIHFNPGPAPEDLVSLRLWVTRNRIISVGRRKSKAIAELDDRIRQGRGPRKTGEFISMLANILHESIEPVIQDLEESMDILEERSLESPDGGLRGNIAGVRKQATLFRRHMTPQRDVVSRLYHSPLPWFTHADKWYLQDSLDRITRFLEEIDTIRERSQILQDELASALSARLNKNLYILSLITVVFMPLTFITGLLGMNVMGIPGADHPMAFLVVCLITIVIAIFQILVFRRLRWV